MAKLVAAHARPPNYMFFFELYECGNLSEKLHVDEWSPRIDQGLHIAVELGMSLMPILLIYSLNDDNGFKLNGQC